MLIENIYEHMSVMESLKKLNGKVEQIGGVLADAINNNSKLLICGNGGSAADAQHFSSELTGRFIEDRIPLPALALTTDSSALTCIGNDYSFDEIFSRQVRGLGRSGDILLLISTSGNSRNLLSAASAAKDNKLTVISLLGKDGGALKQVSDFNLIVESQSTARIQEAQIVLIHTLCGLIEKKLLDDRIEI